MQPLSSASDSFTLAYYTEDGRLKIDYLAPLENRATNSTRVEGTARW